MDFDREFGPIVSLYMCSARCRCKIDSKTKEWTSLSEEEIFRTYGRNVGKIPLDFRLDGLGYTTFRECLEDAAKSTGKDTLSKLSKTIVNTDKYKESADFVSKIENEFKCAGFCAPTLFYFDKPLSQGIPSKTETCSLKQELFMKKEFMNVAFVGVGALPILMCLFCWQYCLWQNFEENERNQNN